MKNQYFSGQKNIFRIWYRILTWECECSQWDFNITERFCWILMGPGSIVMVIKAPEAYSKVMELQNITTVYNNKGSRFDMENERGIFILTVLKKILD